MHGVPDGPAELVPWFAELAPWFAELVPWFAELVPWFAERSAATTAIAAAGSPAQSPQGD